jgi:hypothetical protein
MGGKINTLNEEFDILGSTNFKLLSQTKGNSVNNCDLSSQFLLGTATTFDANCVLIFLYNFFSRLFLNTRKLVLLTIHVIVTTDIKIDAMGQDLNVLLDM